MKIPDRQVVLEMSQDVKENVSELGVKSFLAGTGFPPFEPAGMHPPAMRPGAGDVVNPLGSMSMALRAAGVPINKKLP